MVSDKCKPCKIYNRLYHVFGEAYFSKKNIYKLAIYGFASMNLKNSVETHQLSG